MTVAVATTARSWRTPTLIAAGLVVSAIALWIVLRGLDLAATLEIASGADAALLTAAVVVVGVQAVVRSARWRLLLPRAGGPGSTPVPLARVIPVTFVGYLGNTVLPARLGEAVRSVVIARRESLPVAETLGSALLERVLDTLILATLGLLAAVAVGVADWIIRIALVGLVVSALALGLLAAAPAVLARFRPLRVAAIAGIVDAVRHVAGGAAVRRPIVIGAAVGLSLVAWLLDALIYLLVGRSLGIAIEPLGGVLIAAVAVLSTAVPSAPGYVGTFELAAVAALGALGITGEPALAYALVAHAVAVIPLSLAGAVSLLVLGVDLRGRPVIHARST